MASFPLDLLALSFAVTFFAGFVKGAIGFALPMIMMSALGSLWAPEQALAMLILPVLLTNIAQALRQGCGAARDSAWAYRWHIMPLLAGIVVSAMAVQSIPQAAMFAALGVPITGFALWQLSGRPLALALHNRRRAEVISGVIGGLFGGISGIWGPPLIVLLVSLGAEKREQIRVQGVVFLIGAMMLTVAHLASGVLDREGLTLSALMVLPAAAGMALGFFVQDRLDHAAFRRWTLWLLVLTGLNLVRRALELGL